MAQRQVTLFTDDVTGEELDDGQTVTFALDGVEYEIDLSEEHADQLRAALASYVLHGRRIGGRYTRSSRGSSPGSGRSPESGSSRRASRAGGHDTQAIRAWAQEHGHQVSDRGRIPSSVIAAYQAAH
jgi:Lsr2